MQENHGLYNKKPFKILLDGSLYLKKHFWKENTFWSDGYFACSIGQVSKDVIEKYIQTQGRRNSSATLKG